MAMMTAEFAQRDKIAISASDRKYLLENGHLPPDNWRVWIGDYNREKWAGRYSHSLLHVAEENTPEAGISPLDKPNAQSTVFVVGRLLIFAISSELPRFAGMFGVGRGDRRGIMPRIWPVTADVIYWPPPLPLTDRDADDLAEDLMRIAAAADTTTNSGGTR